MKHSRAYKWQGTGVVVLALVASTCVAQPAALEAFFARYTGEWVRMDPNLAVSTGYFSGADQDAMAQQVTPLSLDFKRDIVAKAQAGLAELATINLTEVSQTQRLAAEVMQWQLGQVAAWEPYLDYGSTYIFSLYPLQQMDGASVDLLNTLAVVHPFERAVDVEHYITRLQLVDERLNEATTEAHRQAELGIVPPDFILQATLQQLEEFVAQPSAENPLVTALAEKSADIADLSAERRAALQAQAETIVEQDLKPAWRAAVAELQAQLPKATADAGVWRFENGADMYARALRFYTTTDLTAEEIHEIGLQEVARIEAEMDTLFRQVGLTDGTLIEREAQLTARLSYPDNEAGREQVMAEIQRILADAKVRSAALFDVVPKSDVIAQPYPEFRWDSAAATYTSPTLDGSRPGIFQMPLRASELNTFGLRSLVYHETVPGHHFQIGLYTENPALPTFMQTSALGYISANVEGWALYAERLAAEQGWYDGDVEGHIGQLSAALFRAKRLVADTGLHAMHWTRQQAIDYGIPPNEVDRYVVWPGQACSYMLGQLKIVQLRERMQAAFGAEFSLREFHNVVLGVGQVPLIVLENAVDAYIADKLEQ